LGDAERAAGDAERDLGEPERERAFLPAPAASACRGGERGLAVANRGSVQ
jgi:hypothetical protein